METRTRRSWEQTPRHFRSMICIHFDGADAPDMDGVQQAKNILQEVLDSGTQWLQPKDYRRKKGFVVGSEVNLLGLRQPTRIVEFRLYSTGIQPKLKMTELYAFSNYLRDVAKRFAEAMPAGTVRNTSSSMEYYFGYAE